MEIFRYIDEKTWNWNKTVSFLSPCGKTEQIDLLIRGGVGGGGEWGEGILNKLFMWRLYPEVNIPFLTEKLPLSFSFY